MSTIKRFTNEIRRELPQAESDLDVALLSVTNLMATLVTARIESGVPTALGNRALLELVKAQEAMVSASGAVAKAHVVMRGVAKEVGAHDIDDCPTKFAQAPETLRIVA